MIIIIITSSSWFPAFSLWSVSSYLYHLDDNSTASILGYRALQMAGKLHNQRRCFGVDNLFEL